MEKLLMLVLLLGVCIKNKKQAFIIGTNMVERIGVDEHTLVRFFQKRIPCSCLGREAQRSQIHHKDGHLLESKLQSS
jgi:hypothetical protein